MDAEIAKMTQKLLGKQGIKFKTNTKVVKGDTSGDAVKVHVEAAKGGKEETVSSNSSKSPRTGLLTIFSSMLMSSSLPSAAAPTLLVLAWRTLVLRPTTAAAL